MTQNKTYEVTTNTKWNILVIAESLEAAKEIAKVEAEFEGVEVVDVKLYEN